MKKAHRKHWIAWIPLFCASATAPASIHVERETGFFGKAAGASGWVVADLDGDGVQEIVAEESTFPDAEHHLFVARWQAQARRLEKVDILSLPLPTETPARSLGIRPFTDENGNTQIVRIDERGDVEIVGGLPLDRRQTYRSPRGLARGFEVADVDADGRPELIILSGLSPPRIDVLDLQRGTSIRWFDIPAGLMAGIAVGQLDGDVGLEVVVGSSTGLLVVDAATGGVEDELPGFYPGAPLIHDIDSDGQGEVLAYRSGTQVVVARTNPLSIQQSRMLPNGINLGIIHVAGDGGPQLIRSNSESSRLEFIPLPGLGPPARSLSRPSGVETPVTIADLDQDGRLEILAVSGLSNSVADEPSVTDLESGVSLWVDSEETGPYGAIDVGNLDLDSGLEIAVASRTSSEGSGSGRLHVIDATTMQEQRRRQGMTEFASGLVDDVRIAELDGDVSREIVWSGAVFNTGTLEIVDALSFTRQAVVGAFDDRYRNYRLSAIGIANPNAGVYASLAVATTPTSTPDALLALVELDSLTGFQIGAIPLDVTQAAPGRIEPIDLDEDGTVEYVFAEQSSVALRRSLLGDRYASFASASPKAFTKSRLANGLHVLVTVGINGSLSLRNAADLSEVGSVALGRPATPTAIRTSDVDPSTILGCAGDTVFKADLRTDSVTWGPRIGVSLCASGRIPSLGAENGRDRIVVGSARGLHVVSVRECIFCDGFE